MIISRVMHIWEGSIVLINIYRACIILSLFFVLENKATIDFDKVNLLELKGPSRVESYVLYVPLLSDSENDWYNFHCSVFKFRQMLDKVVKENVPVVIVIPEKYQYSKTTDSLAPLLEGARVALTWASVFRLLNNVDFRVLLISSDSEVAENSLLQAVNNVLEKNIGDAEAEINELLCTRFFKFKEVIEENKKSNLLVTQFDLVNMDNFEKLFIISPKFSPYSYPTQRIAITGGAGFVGSYLAKALLEQGHQVLVLDNLLCSTGKNILDIKEHENFEFFQIDVSQPFDIEGPLDFVIHLASVPSPYFYYKMPLQTLSGIYGTKNTLDLALKKGACYLFSSTSEVYGDPEISPQTEGYAGRVNPIGRRAPYDQSKRGSETLIKLYFEHYGIDARIVRIFNTYGPGMQLNDGRVITNFIQALLNKSYMTIYGDGRQTRSFCYISDMEQGVLGILQNKEIARFKSIEERIFNIGNPEEFTINEIAQKCNALSVKYFNQKMNITHIKNLDLDDPKIRKPNISYINKITHFEPKIFFDKGLEETLLHFLNT